MSYLKFLGFGIFFGFILIKSEAASWYRIHEMFHFQSFHMFGIIGSAVVIGAISIFLMKKLSANAENLNLKPKPFNKIGNLLGGTLFGLGWAMTGACPGPLYALAGAGYSVILLVIASAFLGVLTYGMMRDRLPH